MLVIRFLFLLIFAIFTGHTLAQVQQGIIKTLGRPEKKGINSRKCNEKSCVEFKVRCLYYLGLSYTAKSDSPKSLGCFKQAVEIGTPVLGPDDESIKECLSIIESLQNEISK